MYKLLGMKRLLMLALLFLSAMGFGGQAYAQQEKDNFQESKKAGAIVEVAPFGKPIFTVYGNIGTVTSEKRAQRISESIVKLSRDAFFQPELLTIVTDNDSINIAYKNEILIAITPQQAVIENKTQNELAHEYLAAISEAVKEERLSHLKTLRIKEIAIAVFIILFTVFCIKGLNYFLSYINNYFLRRKSKNTPGETEIAEEVEFTFKVIKVIKYVLVTVILIICILIFMWLFPATRWMAESLIKYIEKPLFAMLLSILRYIPKLIEIVILLVAFRLADKGLHIIAKKVAAGTLKIKGFDYDWAVPTYQILRIILIVFAFIFIFPLLPAANSSIFKGISVFMGILLSLGSTSIISNIVSGLVITYMRPFNVGDRIKMGEHFGDVIEKNSLVTRIKTTKNEIVTIPNSTIMTANTTNFTNSAINFGLILHTNISVGYEIDWRKVHALLIEAALATPSVLKEPKPFVHQSAFDEFNVIYQINVYTNDASKMTLIYSDLYQNIQDVFYREKIELLSPHINAVRTDKGPVFPPR